MRTGNVVFFCENELEYGVALGVLKELEYKDMAIEETSKKEYCVTLYAFLEPSKLEKIKEEIENRYKDIIEFEKVRDARRVEAIHAIHDIIENFDLGVQVGEYLYKAIYEIQRMRDEK